MLSIVMNGNDGYHFHGKVSRQLVIDTWQAIIRGECIDSLCDQWPCLAIVSDPESVQCMLDRLDEGFVEGEDDGVTWSITSQPSN